MTFLIDRVQVHQVDLPALVLDLVKDVPHGRHIHFVNAYSVVSARADPKLAAVFNAGFSVADGLAVIWAMRILHPRRHWSRQHKVSGADSMVRVLDEGRLSGARHYFLGGTLQDLSELVASVERTFPGVQIVGTASPPFADYRDVDWQPFLDDIRSSDADVVWVGLGTPKQDFVAEQLATMDPRTYCAVGAAFGFLGGSVQRAPSWMSNAGLEWLYRFAQEPRRLWRRYLIGNPRFIQLVVRQRIARQDPSSISREDRAL